MNDKSLKRFPRSITRNLEERNLWSYIVQERLGNTLGYVFKYTSKLTLPVVLAIGIQIVEMLEAVHACGYVYNDIKPTNFIVGGLYQNRDVPQRLKMIDFGLATKYVDDDGHHKE